jgi:subtilisin family serine protease
MCSIQIRSKEMLIAALLSGTFACSSGGLVTEDGPEDVDDLDARAAERYIVTLADQTSTGTAWVEAHGVHAEQVFDHSVRGCVLRGSPEMAEELRRDPTVASVQQDIVVRLGEEAAAPPSSAIGADAAQVLPGGIARVGGPRRSFGGVAYVIDTGIDFDHDDLFVVRGLSRNFVSAEPNRGEDLNFHGTHVAGIIAAKDNRIDVVGVAPNTPVVAVRVLDSEGSGLLSEVIAGVDYVASRGRRGDVANMSLGAPVRVAALDQAVRRAADRGIRFALSAGNDAVDVSTSSPAGVDHPNVFTVSAIGADDCLADFSNFGRSVDFAAPGVGILSTALDGGVLTVDGTSQAAPHVAGILLANGGFVNSDGSACLDPDGIADPIANLEEGDGDDDGRDDDGGGDDGGDDDGGGTNTCSVTQNENQIICTDGDCVCLVDGVQVDTCTADDPESACSSPGNCCGF